ncbi:MAG: hypothetical protein JWO83_3600 [Caulobacteraceae bacterium]|jgi:hypothetical protein|nr:hypothetical protein [Caulobacteraceae bacterium]
MPQRSWWAILVVVVVIVGIVLWRQSHHTATPAHGPAATSVAVRSTAGPYEAERAQAQSAADKNLDAEAVAVVAETEAAMQSIAAGDKTAALAALERATGKANILLARNPATALIPAAVNVDIIDAAPADTAAIEKVRHAAGLAMLANDYVAARVLLDALRSEIRVRTYNLPLATYPMALTAAARLVDQQKMAEAAAVLARARDTVVIIDTVTPIPLLAAQHAIAAAEAAPDRNQKLAALALARASLERAEALGYANAATRKALQGEISNLETQVRGGSDIRTAIANVRQSLADAIRRFTGTKRESRPSS